MPKITLKLNEASIGAAIKKLRAYQKKVEEIAVRSVSLLIAQGVEIAKINVMDMNAYDEGELYKSIIGEIDGNVGFVVAGSTHAAFVEFGSGIVGKDNPHPEVAVAGWKYDVNNHGQLGWWYLDREGLPHWTRGMPSRPYMYQTAKLLRQMVVPMAKEAIK